MSSASGFGIWSTTRPVAFSSSTPSGDAVGGAADDAAGGVRRRRVDRRGRERGVARPERVVVERAERDEAARRDALEVVGGRPGTPAALVPAAADEPGGRASRWAASRTTSIAAVERRRGREVDLVDRQRGVDEVDVRVDEPGHRDLARLELDPAGVRIGARLEVDRRAGEGDLAVADPDRLDPAEAGVAGEGGDATGDEGVERHQADAATPAGGRGARIEHGSPAGRVGEELGERVAVQSRAEARRERDPRLRAGRGGRRAARRRAATSRRRPGTRSRSPAAPAGQREVNATTIPCSIARAAASRSDAAVFPAPVASTTMPGGSRPRPRPAASRPSPRGR